MKLYELTGKYAELQAQMEDGDHEAVTDTLESIEGAIEEKVEAIHRLYRNMQADIDALKAEEKRLSEKRKVLENEQKRLKEYTERELSAAGIDKVNTGIGTVSLRNSPPSVKVLDLDRIPEEFLTPQEPKVDKRGLLKAYKEMTDVDLEKMGFEIVAGKLTLQFR